MHLHAQISTLDNKMATPQTPGRCDPPRRLYGLQDFHSLLPQGSKRTEHRIPANGLLHSSEHMFFRSMLLNDVSKHYGFVIQTLGNRAWYTGVRSLHKPCPGLRNSHCTPHVDRITPVGAGRDGRVETYGAGWKTNMFAQVCLRNVGNLGMIHVGNLGFA